MRDQIELILPTSWEPNRKDFLRALGVSEGGLGEHFFGAVYEAFFATAIELKAEFKKYYSIEYANLAEYLEIRYGETLSEDELAASRVFAVTWLPQVVDTTYEESKLATVLECIQKLEEAQNESQA